MLSESEPQEADRRVSSEETFCCCAWGSCSRRPSALTTNPPSSTMESRSSRVPNAAWSLNEVDKGVKGAQSRASVATAAVNPAVSIIMFALDKLPINDLILYILAQVAGGIAALELYKRLN